MIELVVTAKKGAQGATLDWAEAFRQIPIRRDELWMGVVQWNGAKKGPDTFYVDGNAKFGHVRSMGTFAQVNKAFTTILQKEGFGDIIYWVDDLCVRREPSSGHNFDIPDILRIAEFLGVPLPKEKIREFSNITRYVGLDWYWDSKRVEVSSEKKTKVLENIARLSGNPFVSKEDLGPLCGQLANIAMVVDEGNARIRGLYEMLAQMGKESKWSPEAVQELNWWKMQLNKPNLGMRLCTQRTPDDTFRVHVDACSSWGIAVVISGQYDHFKLADGWGVTKDGKLRDIGWAGFIAVELAVSFLISTHRIRQRHILIRTDNQSVMKAWKVRRSRNSQHNAVLIRIIRALNKVECFISLEYAHSKENPAGVASRGGSPPGLKRRSFASLHKALDGILIRN